MMKIKPLDLLTFSLLFLASSVFVYYGLQAELWYPDDGLYGLWVRGIVENNWVPPFSVPVEQSKICPGKFYYKPLFPLYLMSILYLFGEQMIKLFTPISIILIVLSIFYISKKFSNKWTSFLSAFLFLGIPIVLQWSLGNNTDIFAGLIFLWFFYFLYKTFNNPTRKNLVISGVFFSLTLLTKETMYIISFTLLIVYWALNKFVYKQNVSLKHVLLIALIGFLIASPFFLRNWILYHNPIWPFAPGIFGWDYLDKTGYDIVYEMQKNPLSLILNPVYWLENFLYVIPILIFTLVISIYNLKNNALFKLFFITTMVSILAFIISPSNDPRYLIPLIPTILVMFSYSLEALKKYQKILLVFLVIGCIVALYSMSSLPSILKSMATVPPEEKAIYNYIIQNTTKDAILLDVFTANTPYYTNRTTMFPYQFCGFDLWNFWNKPANETYEIFKRHGINYIIFRLTFMTNEENDTRWGVMPSRAISYLQNNGLIEGMTGVENWALIAKLKEEQR